MLAGECENVVDPEILACEHGCPPALADVARQNETEIVVPAIANDWPVDGSQDEEYLRKYALIQIIDRATYWR